MESALNATIRDILYASMSLDDGLSTIQTLGISASTDSELYFEIARSIEEIILRRPEVANTKLTELVVRLSFSEDRVLPELLLLLDTRYTSGYRLSELDILPDMDAIPQLLDIMGEYGMGMESALRLNLRPLIPFLTDQVITIVDAILSRGHRFSSIMTLHEAHQLAWKLIEVGLFDCADALLNSLMRRTKKLGLDDLNIEVSLNASLVLTELGMYDEARKLLRDLEKQAEELKKPILTASVLLQLSVNETRDESVPYDTARALAKKSAKACKEAVEAGECDEDFTALAGVIIGSNILANGWREGVPQAIEWLSESLDFYETLDESNPNQILNHYKCLVCLGFSHGMLGDHENLTRSVEFMSRAKSVLVKLEKFDRDIRIELGRTENALGWICLSTESDEFWSIGQEAFDRSIQIREELRKIGSIAEIELLGTLLGRKLLDLRMNEGDYQEQLRMILTQYVPLFPTDTRTFIEVAIATYDIVWLTLRHNEPLNPRLLRLFDDLNRMLSDYQVDGDTVFIRGLSLLIPYVESSWKDLRDETRRFAKENKALADVCHLLSAMAIAKMNLETINLQMGVTIHEPVDSALHQVDDLLAHYWIGQTNLAQTIKAFYDNHDYSKLSNGLYQSAKAFDVVSRVETDYDESSEFITATAGSLANILLRFALALQTHYNSDIEWGEDKLTKIEVPARFDFILTEDWLGLTKIAEAYLQMVEQSEFSQAQPYLNAVFSNITRALIMMDNIALVDRRVLNRLGQEMNKRYYLRQ
ncbi:MAG: hypothetical protein BAJATHORv1_10249 [Candidatus Thorarchaeota archaeon]|nr:MAG: hypothetical protein BAJATHORv1_10249 [Candidatus Thorarchaeota archaeon]